MSNHPGLLDIRKDFDIFSGGSGFQQFLYLFGFILLRNPTVIMLDEPDVHLHGSLQAVLLDELKRLVQHDKQVLFATHSRELITRVNPENILSAIPADTHGRCVMGLGGAVLWRGLTQGAHDPRTVSCAVSMAATLSVP